MTEKLVSLALSLIHAIIRSASFSLQCRCNTQKTLIVNRFSAFHAVSLNLSAGNIRHKTGHNAILTKPTAVHTTFFLVNFAAIFVFLVIFSFQALPDGISSGSQVRKVSWESRKWEVSDLPTYLLRTSHG